AWRSRAARTRSQPCSGSPMGARHWWSWPTARGLRSANWSRRCTGSLSSAPCGFRREARSALAPTLQRDDDRGLALPGTEAVSGLERAQPTQLDDHGGRDLLEIVHAAHGHLVDVDGDSGRASRLL